ncbi:hypothetical protein A2867_04350 [Candidatus Daviesbacteria bacterium RIFCSPHIGHO2_01_FULL_40_11]|uniref:YtxH domain-containing protein n=1 Tax=Candidatus Daviesbacteria bacterium RIFCSPHIGHO2_01_FULL_40_11 TaxID=1797762 RepID=A0A1F5JJC2_9BACT|nr:MAG: hypothetical protein A2867_04350 [Candidatus Daviesbacteria bacterium RIFCSPHIGHO2_01_FULL_40_11]OGE62732.1 MAG: hypothetical protein A2964_01125 [Candidatus Daviesbacteria bacterium RIFCSPLOWO2_01_FULL_40_27]
MSDEKKGLNPLATGVAGAMIGAAAAAAAIALSDEKNRKKAEKVLVGLQKQGDMVLKEITKKAMELKDIVGKNAAGVRKLSSKKK